MKIYSLNLHDFKTTELSECFSCFLILGNFDGIHKGHQKILSESKDLAHKYSKKLGAISFEPHPISLFAPNKKNYRITPAPQKRKILEKYLDFLIEINFDKEFSEVRAQDFLKNIILAKLKPSFVGTGKDFIFGHNREGTSHFIAEQSKKFGFNYIAHDLLENSEEIKYSSTDIRRAINIADLPFILDNLGRNYSIAGEVQNGRKHGRELGFPTANVELLEFVIPKFGVYFCKVKILDEKYHGKIFNAVCNIGTRPSFNQQNPNVEVHILNFNDDIYGIEIEVELIKFIREEKKFNSIDDLKNQIALDVNSVKGLT